MRTLTLTLIGLCLHPLAARGQTPTQLVRADATATLGVFTANHTDVDEYGRWGHSGFAGLAAGYYWTDHLKTEIETAWTGDVEAFSYERTVDRPNTYAYSEHQYRVFKVSAGQAYQFGRNAFLHPFVGAGIDIDRQRERIERSIETPTTSNRTDRTDTSVRAHPFAAVGFKAYLTQRAFFRGELKTVVGSRVEHVVWKAGFGVDF